MTKQIEEISVEKLAFDYENPRLVESGVNKSFKEDQLIGLLCETMAVDEIILSMVNSGFFPNDPLIAIKDGANYTVIEGNRRLAAIKVIRDFTKYNKYYPNNLQKPSKAILHSLGKIPVFVEKSRETAWQYIGFKHVNGPAKWSSYAKAEYIAKVHNEFKVPLDDIATQIGDSNKTVQRLYQSLMVLEQAERTKVFNRVNIFSTRLYFSHLYTGLQYDGIREYIGLKDMVDTKEPIQKGNTDKIGEVLTWIYGDKTKNIKPVIVTQNPDLRNLDQVLRVPQSTRTLRATNDLNVAFESSLPDDQKFTESITNAKLELYKSLQYVATGYSGEEDKLRTAGTIAKMSEELYSTMENKYEKGLGRREKRRLIEK
jgi:hypothetical protein